MGQPLPVEVTQQDLATIRHSLMETLEFFEGMQDGIGFTTERDLIRRIGCIRRALVALEPKP